MLPAGNAAGGSPAAKTGAGPSAGRWPAALLALILSGATLLVGVRTACAFALSLRGLDRAAFDHDRVSTLYANDRDGRLVTLASVGARLNGGVVVDLGLPGMMRDGRVLFAAQTMSGSSNDGWRLYIGDPNAAPGVRITPALGATMVAAPHCSPVLKVDPRPVAGPNGEFAFVGAEASGHDSVFMYANDRLSCLARSGARTVQGHVIAALGFGSEQFAGPDKIVLKAWLEPWKRHPDSARDVPALAMVSRRGGIEELAVAGASAGRRARYVDFGLPAALPYDGPVAFSAKTRTGEALFIYRKGAVNRVLSAGKRTAAGRIDHLSLERPGLMRDATTAVLASVRHVPLLLVVARQRPRVRARRGQLDPSGTPLQWFGNPLLTGSGAMIFGAQDIYGNERLYALAPGGTFLKAGSARVAYRVGPRQLSGQPVFSGSLSVNEFGDFAFLGGRRK